MNSVRDLIRFQLQRYRDARESVWFSMTAFRHFTFNRVLVDLFWMVALTRPLITDFTIDMTLIYFLELCLAKYQSIYIVSPILSDPIVQARWISEKMRASPGFRVLAPNSSNRTPREVARFVFNSLYSRRFKKRNAFAHIEV